MILINIDTGPHPPGLDELQPDTAIGYLLKINNIIINKLKYPSIM